MLPLFDLQWALLYLLLGAVVGWLGGLFGIGGGLILVPVLLFYFDVQHIPVDVSLHIALGTSMATILFTSLASLRKHHQHGAVSWHFVWRVAPGILLGTAIGTLLASHIPANFLTIFFALFVYFVAVQILLDIAPHPSRQLPTTSGLTLFGMLTGCLSSLVSIGGGTFIVPFLVWCNFSLRRAIGTSAAVGFPIALGGSVGYIVSGWQNQNLPVPHLGYIYLPALLWIALASVLTAPIGARAAHRMKVDKLRKLFAILLIVIASKMLFKVW